MSGFRATQANIVMNTITTNIESFSSDLEYDASIIYITSNIVIEDETSECEFYGDQSLVYLASSFIIFYMTFSTVNHFYKYIRELYGQTLEGSMVTYDICSDAWLVEGYISRGELNGYVSLRLNGYLLL